MASGGKRPGAGRKAIDPRDKKVQVSISVSRDCRDSMRELKAKGYDINEHIEHCITAHYLRDFEQTYKN